LSKSWRDRTARTVIGEKKLSTGQIFSPPCREVIRIPHALQPNNPCQGDTLPRCRPPNSLSCWRAKLPWIAFVAKRGPISPFSLNTFMIALLLSVAEWCGKKLFEMCRFGVAAAAVALLILASGCDSGNRRSTANPTSSGAVPAAASSSDDFPRELGRYTVLGILTDNQDNSKAKENAETTLLRHPDVGCLVGLWSQNTPMILAALRSSDAIGEVAVVGFDEHPDTLAGIRQGSVHGTIVQQPYAFGYRSVQWLTELAKGREVPVPPSGQIIIPHQAITGENVSQFASEMQQIRAGQGPLLAGETELDGSGIRVAYITNSIDPFWTLAEHGCRRAAEQFGCEVDVQMPSSGSIEEQKRFLESNIAAGLDGIAISPIDPENQTQMINQACEATRVICHDSDAPSSRREFYLGTSNYLAGRAAGKLIKEVLPKGGKVMLFVGKMEVLNAQERSAGIMDELADRPIPAVLQVD